MRRPPPPRLTASGFLNRTPRQPVSLSMSAADPTPPGKRSRWIRRTILGAGLLLSPLFLVAFCVGSPRYYHGKYAPIGPAELLAFPLAPIPEHQTEPHTCGLHAI